MGCLNHNFILNKLLCCEYSRLFGESLQCDIQRMKTDKLLLSTNMECAKICSILSKENQIEQIYSQKVFFIVFLRK